MRLPSATRALLVIGAVATLAACGDASRADSAPSTAGVDGAPAAPANDSLIARADQNRIRGADTASIWVIEVSDFQCPYCATWQQQVYDSVSRELIESGRVRFAYINYPLPSHPNAWPAAIAAMCAAAQDRFWPVHDAIFATQARWSQLENARPFFDSLAVASGADAERLRACVSTEATRPLIQADMDRAIAAGVNATPSFLVGAGNSWTRLSGVQPLSNIVRAIEEERAKQRGGTTPGN